MEKKILGVSLQAVAWRDKGHWRLAISGPPWLIDDMANELLHTTFLRMTSWGGQFEVDEREMLFDQIDRAGIAEHDGQPVGICDGCAQGQDECLC